MPKKLWVQEWEESERGWGTRPDGYTVHARREDVDVFLKAMRDREAEMYRGAVPDEYSRPSGDAYERVFDDEVARKLEEASAGGQAGIWGPGKRPPEVYPQPVLSMDDIDHAGVKERSSGRARRAPTPKEVLSAKQALLDEDRAAVEAKRKREIEERPIIEENARRSNLPSEDPEHICGMMCDGQDGTNSYCARLRRKLFG